MQEELLSEYAPNREEKYPIASRFTEVYKNLVLSDKEFP